MSAPNSEILFAQSVPRTFAKLPAHWLVSSDTFRSSDRKHELFGLAMERKEGGSRGLLVLHGYGEHCARYGHFPAYLDPVVDHIYAFDQRGHGRSQGIRGYTEAFDRYVDDAARAVEQLQERIYKSGKDPEIHLFGHSMGGLIALRLLLLKPELKFASATICAPLLGVAIPVPTWKKGLAYGLSRIYGSLQLSSELDPRGLSHDPDLVECYRSDRLVHSKATPQFFVSLEEAMADTLSRTKGIAPPTLFLLPQADVIVSTEAEMKFASALEHPEKKIVPLEGYKHEAFNEGGEFPKERPFQELSTWIQEHSSAS